MYSLAEFCLSDAPSMLKDPQRNALARFARLLEDRASVMPIYSHTCTESIPSTSSLSQNPSELTSKMLNKVALVRQFTATRPTIKGGNHGLKGARRATGLVRIAKN